MYLEADIPYALLNVHRVFKDLKVSEVLLKRPMRKKEGRFNHLDCRRLEWSQDQHL